MAAKTIIGFVGLPASGKGEAARYLKEKYHAETFRFSTMLRDILGRLYVEQSRDNLIKISEIVRATFGEDILSKTMLRDISKSTAPLIVVDGIRRASDVTKLPDFVLVEIFADIQVRYERLKARGENADDQTKTFAAFQADHERSTEQSILDITGAATERIDNNGTPEALYATLDKLIAKYS